MRRRLFKATPRIKVDKRELAYGIKVELEHTYSRRIARMIALQHLAESPNYYHALRKMERKLGIT